MNSEFIISIFNIFLLFIISLIDIKKLKIHNISVIILFIFGIFYHLSIGNNINEIFYYFLLSALLLFLGFLLFVMGIWGAGDAKLVSVSILFVNLNNVAFMLMSSFIFSALFGLFYIFFKNRFSLEGILKFYGKNRIPFAPGVFLGVATTNLIY